MTSRRPATPSRVDGRGLSAIPGLVDCHTHACFAGDRVEEFSLRAGGASYEELHARGGGILSTVRATRAASTTELADRARRARGLDAPGGHDDLRGEVRATGSTTTPSSRSCAQSRTRAASRPGSARTPSRPSSRTPGAAAYVEFLVEEVLPEAAQLAEAADVFLERGAFDVEQARRYLTACRGAGLALRLHGDQFTESGAIPLADRAGRPVRRPPRGDGRGVARRRSRRATSPASSFRRARCSSTARCRPPARSSTRAPRSRSRRTSTRAVRSARASRSSARSPRRR